VVVVVLVTVVGSTDADRFRLELSDSVLVVKRNDGWRNFETTSLTLCIILSLCLFNDESSSFSSSFSDSTIGVDSELLSQVARIDIKQKINGLKL